MYYLPIYVNNRRMHVVKLERDANNLPLFTFLVNSTNSYDVFSLPSSEIKMISEHGGEDSNVDLKNVDYYVEELSEEEVLKCFRNCEGIPVYNVNIKAKEGSGKNAMSDEAKKMFRFVGHLGETIAPEETPFTLKALTSGKTNRPKEYIIQFSYEETDEYEIVSSYYGGIRICEYENEKEEVIKATLDFGSEASQIHLSTDRDAVNMNIRDAFVKMVGEDINKDYWQGRQNDDKTLYKSIYHVNTHPAKTDFGELPMCNGRKTFLQSVLAIDAPTKDYVLLPNLKLIELLEGVIANKEINFDNGGFMGNISVPLTNNDLNDGILRQILCNFLAVTMNSEAKRKYLHFILLVPNVYRQEKVHKLIEGLYEDFDLLRKNKKFNSYKGIEVNIVSESDASFFGIRALTNRETLPWKKGAKYLIIDAGKGTTDFSIIAQEGENLSNYNSMYRSGIPASGHVLTYAFYEALRSYFHQLEHGQFFDDIMRIAVGKETSDVLDFVGLLEKFKIEFSTLHEDKELENEISSLVRNNNKQLRHLNTFLSKALNNSKMIPGMHDALNKKIDLMTNLIKDSIVNYAKTHNVTCENVFLTGRAFMLKPFRDSITEMLIKEKIVKEDGVFYKDSLTKSMCTYGAMIAGQQSVVNKNSSMLGSPNLVREYGDSEIMSLKSKIWKYIRKKLGKEKKVGVDMSFDFFYEGLQLLEVRNAIFSLSGNDTKIGLGDKEDLVVYFVGDGFIWKHGNTVNRIQSDSTISGVDDTIRKKLVKESIFPFDIVSFDLDKDAVSYKEESSTNEETNLPKDAESNPEEVENKNGNEDIDR